MWPLKDRDGCPISKRTEQMQSLTLHLQMPLSQLRLLISRRPRKMSAARQKRTFLPLEEAAFVRSDKRPSPRISCDPDVGILSCSEGLSCQSTVNSMGEEELLCMPVEDDITSEQPDIRRIADRRLQDGNFCDYNPSTRSGTKCYFYEGYQYLGYCGPDYYLPAGYCYDALVYYSFERGRAVEYGNCYIIEGSVYPVYELCLRSVGTDLSQCIAELDGVQCNSCEVLTSGQESCYRMDCSNTCVGSGGIIDTCQTSSLFLQPVVECFPYYRYCGETADLDTEQICDYPAQCESDEGYTIPEDTIPANGYCFENRFTEYSNNRRVDCYKLFPESDPLLSTEICVDYVYGGASCVLTINGGQQCTSCVIQESPVETCIIANCSNTCANATATSSSINSCDTGAGLMHESLLNCLIQGSNEPTQLPSGSPTDSPTTATPSSTPSDHPSSTPSEIPSDRPSSVPSRNPTEEPSSMPSSSPSTKTPTGIPSSEPSFMPSVVASSPPTLVESMSPSKFPSTMPSGRPSSSPSAAPSGFPSANPSTEPSTPFPSNSPSVKASATPSALLVDESDGSVVLSASPVTTPTVIRSTDPPTSPTGNNNDQRNVNGGEGGGDGAATTTLTRWVAAATVAMWVGQFL